VTGKRSRTVRRGVVGKVFDYVKQLAGGSPYLASVLNSPVAVAASLHVVRAFVRLRQMISTHKELAAEFRELELRVEKHDQSICSLFEAIEGLLEQPEAPRLRIGFKPKSR